MDKASNDVMRLEPTKPDTEVAAELKLKIAAKTVELCTILDEANKAGFEVALQMGKGPLGKQVISQLVLAKHF